MRPLRKCPHVSKKEPSCLRNQAGTMQTGGTRTDSDAGNPSPTNAPPSSSRPSKRNAPTQKPGRKANTCRNPPRPVPRPEQQKPGTPLRRQSAHRPSWFRSPRPPQRRPCHRSGRRPPRPTVHGDNPLELRKSTPSAAPLVVGIRRRAQARCQHPALTNTTPTQRHRRLRRERNSAARSRTTHAPLAPALR